MKTNLLVSIDTEENWEGPGSNKKPNVSNIYKILDLQKDIFDKFNIKPVYLITYPVANDAKCISIFQEILQGGRCEIGAHLHNWNSPPFTEKDVLDKSYHFRLPYSIEKQKIEDLTKIIQDNFKIQPITFRAGRWGADGETIKILTEIGYKVDLSVLPLTDYTAEGGINFYGAPFEPYFPLFDDINIPDKNNTNRQVLEIPVTCGFSLPDFERLRSLYNILQKNPFKRLHLIGALYRLKVLKKLKLSPEAADFKEMKTLVDNCLKRNYKILHLTFHSSMNSAGDSIFAKDGRERNLRIKYLYDILEYIIKEKKIKNCITNDIYEIWKR